MIVVYDMIFNILFIEIDKKLISGLFVDPNISGLVINGSLFVCLLF